MVNDRFISQLWLISIIVFVLRTQLNESTTVFLSALGSSTTCVWQWSKATHEWSGEDTRKLRPGVGMNHVSLPVNIIQMPRLASLRVDVARQTLGAE